MARIRVHCPYCSTTALLAPPQVLLVAHGGGTYLFTCPACARVIDDSAGAEHVLLLAAAGVRPVGTGRVHEERS